MPEIRFLEDLGMDFAVRCVLTGVRYGMAEAGEIVAVVREIEDGDPDSWFDAWVALGRRAKAIGDGAAAAGRRESAWPAYLRAANYLFCGNYYAPATRDPARAGAIWSEHRDCWDAAVANWPTPAGPITVPFEDTSLPGYWFAADDAGPRPVQVIVNGIETPMSDTVMTGLADGLARGYDVVCFDGPGQGAALYRQGLTLRPDWESVLAAVVEFIRGRSAADAGGVCLMGINHGGWFAARAASRGIPYAALVLDPPAVALGSDPVDALPDELRALYLTDPDRLDAAAVASVDPDVGFNSVKTRDPFSTGSLREALDRLGEMNLGPSELSAIAGPVYVADPEEAESFAGQTSAFLDGLAVPAHVDRFTRAEGAGLDCEILAPQVRNQRVYDWLDDTVGG